MFDRNGKRYNNYDDNKKRYYNLFYFFSKILFFQKNPLKNNWKEKPSAEMEMGIQIKSIWANRIVSVCESNRIWNSYLIHHHDSTFSVNSIRVLLQISLFGRFKSVDWWPPRNPSGGGFKGEVEERERESLQYRWGGVGRCTRGWWWWGRCCCWDGAACGSWTGGFTRSTRRSGCWFRSYLALFLPSLAIFSSLFCSRSFPFFQKSKQLVIVQCIYTPRFEIVFILHFLARISYIFVVY